MSTSSAASRPRALSQVLVDRDRLVPLTFTAIGVVFGDIGTSVLYAMRECFFGSHWVPPTHDNVLGVLSLIIYSLVLVIAVKYVGIVLASEMTGSTTLLAPTLGACAVAMLVAMALRSEPIYDLLTTRAVRNAQANRREAL